MAGLSDLTTAWSGIVAATPDSQFEAVLLTLVDLREYILVIMLFTPVIIIGSDLIILASRRR